MQVITVGVMVLALWVLLNFSLTLVLMLSFSAWYFIDGHRHYHGPQSNLNRMHQAVVQDRNERDSDSVTA